MTFPTTAGHFPAAHSHRSTGTYVAPAALAAARTSAYVVRSLLGTGNVHDPRVAPRASRQSTALWLLNGASCTTNRRPATGAMSAISRAIAFAPPLPQLDQNCERTTACGCSIRTRPSTHLYHAPQVPSSVF